MYLGFRVLFLLRSWSATGFATAVTEDETTYCMSIPAGFLAGHMYTVHIYSALRLLVLQNMGEVSVSRQLLSGGIPL